MGVVKTTRQETKFNVISSGYFISSAKYIIETLN